jgi:toxin ParE1/3/4
MKALVIQRRALHDMEQARTYYEEHALHMVPDLARELDAALLHLQRNPGTGSPRWGLLLGLAGLRVWRLSQFPYVIFYFDHPHKIEVVRVLHQSSDIPKHLEP